MQRPRTPDAIVCLVFGFRFGCILKYNKWGSEMFDGISRSPWAYAIQIRCKNPWSSVRVLKVLEPALKTNPKMEKDSSGTPNLSLETTPSFLPMIPVLRPPYLCSSLVLYKIHRAALRSTVALISHQATNLIQVQGKSSLRRECCRRWSPTRNPSPRPWGLLAALGEAR